MKRVNSYGNGDHYVHIKIAIPKKLSNEQKALIQVSGQFVSRPVINTNGSQKVTDLSNWQAYAELEADTPGTIFGIAQKGDGKSNTSFDSKKTQGERDDDYTSHDRSGDAQYQAEVYEKQRMWKIFGGLMVLVLAYLFTTQTNEYSTNVLSEIATHDKGMKTDAELRHQFKDA